MKCLPTTKLAQAHGNVLHDWHAEIIAIRAFNRFLLEECRLLSTPPHPPSRFVRRRETHEQTQAAYQPFEIKDDVQIHMYCSEAPCGDASMELVMDAQEDAMPWTTPPPTITSADQSRPTISDQIEAEPALAALRGRSNFNYLGVVRLKPSRPDAPPTLSKSCTDKLAFTQCASLLSSLTSLLIAPKNAYLSSLILPRSQLVETACRRAFSRSGRMGDITKEMEERWRATGGGYEFKEFGLRATEKEFRYSRRSLLASEKAVASNISAVHTPYFQETLIGGVLQGRKQFDPRGASAICRRSLWKAMIEIAALASMPALVDVLNKGTYMDVKSRELLKSRRDVKDDVKKFALKGWVRNSEDDFRIEDKS
ncbi:hypothetical protein CC78DRAFT_214946 [Lojkania enalia]|uniref:A to I editase domain-containing protein n=1 Tax=Lojkania enalia TaxID=147567 RepID=A0A9P4KAX4_9PLEO|nr:hypothetical protein CC78DRAFT_214946 [Didymosphaeria enalia]